MPSFEPILNLLFGDQIPSWVRWLIGGLLFAWLVLYIISKIAELWADTIVPRFYDREEKRRSLRRQRFADHVESEIYHSVPDQLSDKQSCFV